MPGISLESLAQRVQNIENAIQNMNGGAGNVQPNGNDANTTEQPKSKYAYGKVNVTESFVVQGYADGARQESTGVSNDRTKFSKTTGYE